MFDSPNSNTVLATFSSVFATFLTELPAAINLKLSRNGIKITNGLFFDILSKIPLIYIRKNMGETGDSYWILVSISLLLLLFLLIISMIFTLDRRYLFITSLVYQFLILLYMERIVFLLYDQMFFLYL